MIDPILAMYLVFLLEDIGLSYGSRSISQIDVLEFFAFNISIGQVISQYSQVETF